MKHIAHTSESTNDDPPWVLADHVASCSSSIRSLSYDMKQSEQEEIETDAVAFARRALNVAAAAPEADADRLWDLMPFTRVDIYVPESLGSRSIRTGGNRQPRDGLAYRNGTGRITRGAMGVCCGHGAVGTEEV
jgi:hypothetical protein